MQKLSGKMERIRTTLWRTIRIVPKKKTYRKKDRGRQKTLLKRKYFFPAFLVLKMGNGREKQADSEGGKNK